MKNMTEIIFGSTKMTCNNFTSFVYRLDCEKVRKGLGNTARDLANSLLQNIVDTYRKENERYIIHKLILAFIKKINNI